MAIRIQCLRYGRTKVAIMELRNQLLTSASGIVTNYIHYNGFNCSRCLFIANNVYSGCHAF